MTRRRPPLYVETKAREALRSAFQPYYSEPLTDEDVGEMADNLRRFYSALGELEAAHRARKGRAGSKA